MNIKLISIAAISLALFSTASYADFGEGDWKVQGDKQLFVDEINEQVFLDLDITKGQSLQNIENRFATDLQGWRFATEREMANFFWAVTGYDPYGETHVFLEIQSTLNFQAMLGITGRNSTNYGYQYLSKGLYLGEDDKAYAFELNSASGDSNYVAYQYYRGSDKTTSRPNAGVWLTPDENNLTLFQQNNAEYNTNDASTPFSLSALSLIMLGLFRKKYTNRSSL